MITRVLLAGIALAMAAWPAAHAATECIESKWGADDTLGSANLVTEENTLKAVSLVKQGKSVPLGIVIDSKTPAFSPRSLSLQVVQPNQQGGQKLEAFGYPGNYNDDVLQTWIGIGSQIDGLGHLGEGGLYYNCLDEKEISAIGGLTKLGVHDIPPLVGRGVVLDMTRQMGKDMLAAGDNFGEADIKAAAEAQGVTLGKLPGQGRIADGDAKAVGLVVQRGRGDQPRQGVFGQPEALRLFEAQRLAGLRLDGADVLLQGAGIDVDGDFLVPDFADRAHGARQVGHAEAAKPQYQQGQQAPDQHLR